jgi:hypothetical protein
MIKELLEKCGLALTDAEFKEVMEATTQDIKFNNINFGKKTDIYDVIIIATIFHVVLHR